MDDGGDANCRFQLILRVEGKPEGSLCGSQHINEEFLRWLKQEARQKQKGQDIHPFPASKEGTDLASWCKEAGLSVDDALRQANVQFELMKVEFFETGLAPEVVKIYSSSGNEEWHVHVTSDLMVACWHPILTKIKAHIESQFTAGTTLIIMAGAISRSEYFLNTIKDFLKTLNTRYNSDSRVVDGARQSGHSITNTAALHLAVHLQQTSSQSLSMRSSILVAMPMLCTKPETSRSEVESDVDVPIGVPQHQTPAKSSVARVAARLLSGIVSAPWWIPQLSASPVSLIPW